MLAAHMIIFAVALHLAQGTLLIVSDTAGWVTSTSHVREWLGVSADVLGGIYIAIAISAIMGLRYTDRYSPWRVASAVPQQFFLVMAAMGAGLAIYESAFADGVVRSRAFIAADQISIILMAGLHAVAVLDWRLEILWQKVKTHG